MIATPKSRDHDITIARVVSILAAFSFISIAVSSLAFGSDALQVFDCGFEREADRNYDRWPDGWRRARGPRYPHYLDIEIDDTHSAKGGYSLRVELDGGSAAVFTPEISLSSLYSYVFEVQVRAESLKHSLVYMQVDLFDVDDRLLVSHTSEKVYQVPNWRPVRIGPIAPPAGNKTAPSLPKQQKGAHHAVLSLHVESGEWEDLDGTVWFDDLHIARLPRVTLTSSIGHNVYTAFEDVDLECDVSGISVQNPKVHFELIDRHGTLLREETRVFRATHSRTSPAEPSRFGAVSDEAAPGPTNAFSSSATWKPFESLPRSRIRYGYYEVRATVAGDAGESLIRRAALVVAPPLDSPTQSEFGWSLPQGDRPLEFKKLTDLLGQSAVNWIKFPIWFSEENIARSNDLARFAERLTSRNIQLIGVLDQPPASKLDLFGDGDKLPVALIFVEPELWGRLLNPIMTRLSLKVAWWQLGGDGDTSFIGFPNIEGKVREVQSHLERFGQSARIGLNWDWMHEQPDSKTPSWAFLCQSAEPALTAKELAKALQSDKSRASHTWVMLRPLEKQSYTLETRAKDLACRLLTAKRYDVQGIFLANPFAPETGVMTPDGQPADLFLPWRTTCSMLSGATFLGVLELPHQSQNMVFEKNGRAMLVVWNDRPTEEVLYLGEAVEQTDLWSHTVSVRETADADARRQIVRVDRLPTFITGLDLQVARWRLDCQFDRTQLSSAFGREQTTTLQFTNSFPQGVNGTLVIETPDVWTVEPRVISFRNDTRETRSQPLRILLRADASVGDQQVRVDFEIQADRSYTFSVFRTMRVGFGDIEIELLAKIDEAGNLIVDQTLTNRSEEMVSFNCLLFPPSRRRERKQVFDMTPGIVTDRYVIPQGKELAGQTVWLRAEEIGGQGRVLNYHVVVPE